MKKSLFLFLILLSQSIFSQGTYYKLYSNQLRNIIQDIEINENHIIVTSLGLLKEDSNLYSLMTNLSKINMKEGFIIKTVPKPKLLPDYFGMYSFDRLTKFENNFIVSGHEIKKAQDTKFYIFNSDLEDQREFSILSADAITIGNEGNFVDDSILYSYGLLQKDEVMYANIKKYDLRTNTINWDKIFKKGKRLNQMWDFQKTHDGNFIFIMYHKDADAGSGSNSGYQIIKIDDGGNILDTFNHRDLGADKQRILSSKEGAIYYSTDDNPFNPIIPSNGRINKLSENMDTILWSVELPSNAITDGNRYEIYDYIQANNGDIMACGKVWHMPGGPLVAGLNATWNGFVTRISQKGELKWVRIYRLPNENPILPKKDYGKFRPGQIDKILETEEGTFVLGGTAYYNNTQLDGLLFGDTLSLMWIMVVDENGCIEGEECAEVVHLHAKNDAKFNIGDQWTYEEEEQNGGGNASIKYATFVVTDSMKEEVLTKYVLNEEDTFYVQDDKMFFWDEHYQEYIVYYDFNSTSSYDIKFYDPFRKSDEIATVFIDSVSYRHFGKDSLKAQHIHVLNSGTIEDYQEIIYEGIGAENYGIKLVLGCGLCDFNPYITKLRCFSSDMMTYSFVAYACDSTWFTTDTKEIDAENIKIYPNPTTNLVWIDGIDQDIAYELHSATGKLIHKGYTKDKSVFIEGNGIFILKLNDKNNWINKRVVKIE